MSSQPIRSDVGSNSANDILSLLAPWTLAFRETVPSACEGGTPTLFAETPAPRDGFRKPSPNNSPLANLRHRAL